MEFYKDVPGIFDKDPNAYDKVFLKKKLTYKEALNIIDGNHPVLHPRCVRLAGYNILPLSVYSFIDFNPGKLEGTLIEDTGSLRLDTCHYEEQEESYFFDC